MSASRAPPAANPPDQIMHSMKRQLPFSSMKPPFVAAGDYHRHDAAEAIVVKTPLLKRKSEVADFEADSGDRMTAGFTEAANSPFQTPVSGKTGKGGKSSRLTKGNRVGTQTPGSNIGSPAGSNLTPAGPCRYDSSLGLLTKKFINLIKQAEDGILDLNKAADTLEAEVENLTMKERQLDEQIREMQERLRDLSEDENNDKLLFVTEEDIKNLPCFQNETLIAIKAPHGTTLEVPDPDEFEEINGADVAPKLPSSPDVTKQQSTVVPEDRGKHIEVQGQAAPGPSSDFTPSQDFVSGIMKIVPSDVASEADYWLLSDADVSITDMWRTEPGVEWNELEPLQEDYCMTDENTTTPSHPSNVGEVSSASKPTGG
ncbi:hypothetical protein JHK85_033964 [Glycine max]|nr:hypothetical protein JHK85_033964 [Glycine max]